MHTAIGGMSKRIYRAGMVGLALALAVASGCVSAEPKAVDGGAWRVLRNSVVSLPAWSPGGHCIAFVTEDESDDIGMPGRASIWLAALKQGQISSIRRLVRVTRDDGIPTALFWLGKTKIGWAASRYPKHDNSFRFVQMGLRDRRPRPLIDRSFTGVQGTGEVGGFGAPDDVYYDAGSRTLLFSAALPPDNDVYVRILSLATGEVRITCMPHAKGLAYPDGYVSCVTLCGSVGSSKNPRLYLAACILDQRSGYYFWRSDSWRLRQDKVLAISQQILSFPRTSPNGKLLAYVRKGTQIMLRDLASGKERALVGEFHLGQGCPFSWSPDGKRLVYGDGARIKIVRVVPDATSGKE